VLLLVSRSATDHGKLDELQNVAGQAEDREGFHGESASLRALDFQLPMKKWV